MGILPMLGRDLELTDAQRDQIKAIADSHKDDWKALADRARTAHMALNEAVTADTIDEALIRQKSSEVAAVDADMAVARARAHAEVFQILTAEQKAKKPQAQEAATPGARRAEVGSLKSELTNSEPDFGLQTSSRLLTMCVAEIPKRSRSSSGFPLRGISRTARRWTVNPASATASATASPMPPAA